MMRRRVFTGGPLKRFKTSTSRRGGDIVKARLIFVVMMACLMAYYMQAAVKVMNFALYGFHDGGI